MTKGSDTSFFKLVLSSPYNHNILNIRAGFFRQVELKGGRGLGILDWRLLDLDRLDWRLLILDRLAWRLVVLGRLATFIHF